MKPFEFFEHTADIGVHVYGRTQEELFVNAARALYEVQGRFGVSEHGVRPIEIEAATIEELLANWLAELLYLFDAHGVYFKDFKLEITDGKKLKAKAEGGPIDFSQSDVHEEIKAVTYHQLDVRQTPEGWTATVIFDV